MNHAFLLAAKNKLTVRTNNVGEDKQAKRLIVNISVGDGVGENCKRECTLYFVKENMGKDSDWSKVIREFESEAIYSFLGQLDDVVVDSPKEEPEESPKEEPKEEPKESPKEEPKEEPKKERPVKKAKKKAAKKAVKKVEKPAPVVEDEPELDLPDDEDEVETQSETVLYDKGDKGHQSHLRPILIECFGEDWKSSAEIRAQVLDLIKNKLDGKIPVTDISGKLLKDFRNKVLTLID